MGWSAWSSKATSKNSDGSRYVLYYRTNSFATANKVDLEYYVLVDETGSTYSERWNCVVEVNVDGKLHAKGWSNKEDYSVSNSSGPSGSYYHNSNVEGHSGYYKGYKCIPNKTLTKDMNSSGDASWTISVAGGFRSVANRNCTCSVTASGESYATVGVGTTTITDNYNNSFTITAKAGAKKTNNDIKGLINLKWGYNTNYSDTYTVDSNGKWTYKFNPTTTDKTRRVYAQSKTDATYGTDPVSKACDSNGKEGVPIRQYVGPEKPTELSITSDKGRFTLRENWTISWTAPTINNECPIKGYRIRLYRKRGTGAWIKLPIYDSNGGMGHVVGNTTASPTDYYWDRDGTSTSATIYMKYYNKNVIPGYPDILPGDSVKFAVTAYTRYGSSYTGAQKFKTSEAFSSEFTVKNAGIVHVKNSSGSWVEGQVNVYVNGAWKEAEVVQVKTASGSWVESN